jgi:hypothetical protein
LLYHNRGDGTFTDVSEKAGISQIRGNFGLGVAVGDFDNDGWPDIYVADDTTPALFFHNLHNGTFEEIGTLAGAAYDANGKETSGMGIAAGDFDRDGWLDLLKTNIADETVSLYNNTRDGYFLEASARAGVGRNRQWVGWGCGFFDFDNDGWLDIFLVNGHIYPEVVEGNVGSYSQPKVLYRNAGGGRFEDVSDMIGRPITTPSPARGLAFGDFDNDGDLDVVINNIGDVPSLLRLDSSNGNHWLQIYTIGTKSNRAGIGARIVCVTGDIQQIDEVRSGGSYLSQSDLRVHFGLGKAKQVDLLEIRWPSGIVDKVQKLGVDQLIYVKEGVGIIRSTAMLKDAPRPDR